MKILVKGNITARKHIASMIIASFDDIHTDVVVDKDTDYDIVFYGDMNIDSLLLNGAELFVTGSVICLGEE